MVYKVKFENSVYYFNLENLLKNKNVSKYMLEKDTGIDHKTIQNYCLGNLKRLDITSDNEFLELSLTEIDKTKFFV